MNKNGVQQQDFNVLCLWTSLINVQRTHKWMSCVQLIDLFKQQKKHYDY